MAGYDLAPLAASWMRSLKARKLSANTQRIYGRAITDFGKYLETYEPTPTEDDPDPRPAPTELEGDQGIHREHIERYIIGLIERTSAGNAHQHFRSLRTFFNWLVDEEEMNRSPMRKMKPPEPGEVEVPVIPDDALKKLLATCKSTSFIDRRDRAILLMFLDTGGRLSEITDRTQEKLDLDINVLHVLGKGNRERPLPFGRATAQAMDRYLRAAAKYLGRPLAPSDPLWVSYKRRDALTIWGVGEMIEKRCKAAGIPHIHPHQFRHTFAHQWKLNEGNEDALMRIMGWKSREMLSRYGASAGEERARRQHQDLSPGDRLK
ncbi:tyrosine-type recombinase/integrase [Actinacidiphila rubida]|uniref:Site-specific recombinase XerD n=1 Tax=Actinacidiphila rubida TaxID=310780 RepID=A0A1H8SVT8_9ACTN|nr:tyrosine-type recombinase/integrase [Actinacidiphila rubida]SEO82655.1 Site-specific recombinase XerD [Actinacidiphila rubida]